MFLQALLEQEGVAHLYKCVSRGEEDDLAHRLAINVKYRVKGTGEQGAL